MGVEGERKRVRWCTGVQGEVQVVLQSAVDSSKSPCSTTQSRHSHYNIPGHDILAVVGVALLYQFPAHIMQLIGTAALLAEGCAVTLSPFENTCLTAHQLDHLMGSSTWSTEVLVFIATRRGS